MVADILVLCSGGCRGISMYGYFCTGILRKSALVIMDYYLGIIYQSPCKCVTLDIYIPDLHVSALDEGLYNLDSGIVISLG